MQNRYRPLFDMRPMLFHQAPRGFEVSPVKKASVGSSKSSSSWELEDLADLCHAKSKYKENLAQNEKNFSNRWLNDDVLFSGSCY